MTEINAIVAKAAFLYERMQPPFLPIESGEGPEPISRLMDTWLQIVGKGEREPLETRLAQDRLNFSSVQALAAASSPGQFTALPDWADRLTDILRLARTLNFQGLAELEQRFQFLHTLEPLGFKHLLVPFVEYASVALKNACPDLFVCIAPSAFLDLQRGLLKSLSTVARDTLYLEFSIWRSSWLLTQIEQPAGADEDFEGRAMYSSFLNRVWTADVPELFQKYPVLGRMLAEITGLWIVSTKEFVSRLSDDHSELARVFPHSAALGKVTHVRTGLSDRHNGGRTVLGLKFENGTSLIYKSKDSELQQMLDGLFQWLMKNTSILSLPVCEALYRPEYYWVKQTTHAPCETGEEISRYYQRAGILACIMYLLGGYDFHAENLIASGEYPVIIDTETILHPELRLTSDTPPGELHDSVLRTCMFPRRSRPQKQKDYNCGLAHKETTSQLSSRLVWQHVNTDRMRLVKQDVVSPTFSNFVHLQGRFIPAEEGLKDILAGFKHAYELLMETADRLFDSDGPLSRMSRLRPRFVFRNTAAYEQVLRDAWQPQSLRDGMEASLRFDALSRALLKHPSNLRFWPLFVSEHAHLAQGDIPMFFHSAETGALILGPEKFLELRNAHECSGFRMMRSRFDKMSAEDCENQMNAIVESFKPS